MNSFTLWQACEGTLSALWRSAVRMAVSTYRIVAIVFFTLAIIVTTWLWPDNLPLSRMDFIQYVGLFMAVSLLVYLANKEIKISLEKTRASEKLLEAERQALEEHMSRRTQELVTTERERLNQLKRTAQFGELSQGLFHDLMNPLSSIALYVDKIDKTSDVSPENRNLVEKVVGVSKRMRSFMDSVRHCLGEDSNSRKTASLSEELSTVRDVLAYKARQAQVEIRVDQVADVMLPIHPVRVYQLFLNLISNAVEACESVISPDREMYVRVAVIERSKQLIIKVEDNGCGIPAEKLPILFTKAFSTKKNGLGIGLSTIHSIVVHELKGSVEVESGHGAGTKFIITLPS